VSSLCGAAPTLLSTIEGCGKLRMTIWDGTLSLANDTGDASGNILSLPTTGGTAMPIATPQNQPNSIEAGSDGVFWSTAQGSVYRLEPAGVTPTEIATAVDPAPRSVAVANGKAFYSSGDQIFQVPVAGGAAGYVTCTPLNGVIAALDASDGGGDADGLYWTSDQRQAVEAEIQANGVLPVDDMCLESGDAGEYIEVAESQGSLLHDVVLQHGGFLYWATGDRVARSELAAPTAQTVAFALDFDNITGLAIADTATPAVYYAGNDGLVQKFPLSEIGNAQAEAVPVARDQSDARYLVTDAANLYWLTDDCRVWSTPL
jgi:hypothetical protein